MRDDFESIFSFVQTGIYVYDIAKGVNKYINKQYTAILGYKLQELNDMSPDAFLDLFHPDDQKAIIEHMSLVSKLKRGDVSTIEYRFKSKSKEWVWCLSQDTGYEYDDKGNLLSMVGSIIDITHQKQTETDLKEITKSHQKVVENSPLGMHFYTINDDKQLIFESANKAASQILGIDNQQFIGKTIEEAFPALLETEVPKKYHEAATYGRSWTSEQLIYEDETIMGAFKITAFQTKPGSMVAIFDDITEQKKAEIAIKQSEELYRFMADTSTDMIARHDESGVFLYVSPACRTLLGYEPEELVGQSAFDFFHPDDLAKLEENRGEIIEHAVRTTVTFRFRKKNGDYTWFETNTHTIFEKETGAVLELHASSRDVSERVEAEQVIQKQNQLLEELNASKDKFFSILSHDLRSPLSSLTSLLELFSKNVLDYKPEEIGHHMGLITNSTKNLLSLVDDILLWANSQSGRIPFSPQNSLFSILAQETIDIANTTATAKNISISIIDPNKVKVFADVNMLSAILRNLVSNAIKFTNKDGKILIKVNQDENSTTISVIDNGIGMTQELKEKLFINSGSSSNPGTEGEKGTGIGLILCQDFVDKHKGTIWVKSKLGEGSSFSFKLPMKCNTHTDTFNQQ